MSYPCPADCGGQTDTAGVECQDCQRFTRHWQKALKANAEPFVIHYSSPPSTLCGVYILERKPDTWARHCRAFIAAGSVAELAAMLECELPSPQEQKATIWPQPARRVHPRALNLPRPPRGAVVISGVAALFLAGVLVIFLVTGNPNPLLGVGIGYVATAAGVGIAELLYRRSH